MGFLLLNTEVCLKKGQGFECFGGTSLSNCPLFKVTPSPRRDWSGLGEKGMLISI